MRNACMITLCLGLAGCRAFPANPPPIESRPPIHRPAEIHPTAPVAVQEHKDPQVIYLQLVNNDLRAIPRDISTPAASTYSPPIVVPTAPVPDAAEHPRFLQLLKPEGQQGGRHERHAAAKIVEVAASSSEFPDDYERPAFAEDLGGLRHRTELTV